MMLAVSGTKYGDGGASYCIEEAASLEFRAGIKRPVRPVC
jgi:hypothetical protein